MYALVMNCIDHETKNFNVFNALRFAKGLAVQHLYIYILFVHWSETTSWSLWLEGEFKLL